MKTSSLIIPLKNGIYCLLAVVLVLGAAQVGFGQVEVEWENNYGVDRTDDCFTSIKPLSDGSFLLTGQTFDHAGANQPRHLLMVKINDDGEELWSSIHEEDDYSFTAYGVLELPRGRFALSGAKDFPGHHYYNWFAFTDNRGNVTRSLIPDERFGSQFYEIFPIDDGYMLAGKSGYGGIRGNFWLYQVDSDGAFVRLRHYEGFRVSGFAGCVRTADGGYVYAGTSYWEDARRKNFCLLKVDQNRDSLWSKSFGGDRDDECFAMRQTSDGGFILIGDSESFGGWHKIWLIRTNSNGDCLWTSLFDGVGHDIHHDVIEAEGGGFAIAAKMQGADGRSHGWLIRTDQHGTLIWSSWLGGARSEAFHSIAQTDDGGFILGGVTELDNNLERNDDDLYVVKTTPDPTISHRIPLNRGWNLISTVCWPGKTDFKAALSELVLRQNLLLAKDQAGRFYNPNAGEDGFSNMNGWDVRQGYLIKVSESDTLEIINIPVNSDNPIPLRRGWNYVSYFPEVEIDVREAFEAISDQLVTVKDDMGRFYNPEFEYSNMLPLCRGQGYQVAVSRACELTYPAGGQRLVQAVNPPGLTAIDRDADGGTGYGRLAAADRKTADYGESAVEIPSHFQPTELTGSNMSLIVNAEFGMRNAEYEIGVFTENGLCVGASSFQNPHSKFQIGLAIWADDPTTPEIDGAVEGEALSFRLWDGKKEWNAEFGMRNGEWGMRNGELNGGETSVASPQVTEGFANPTHPVLRSSGIENVLRFQTDGFVEVTLDVGARHAVPLPENFALQSAFPNPFNNVTSIRYSLPVASDVKLSVFDLSGREIVTLVSGTKSAGNYTVEWNAGNLGSGLFLLRLDAGDRSITRKVMLVK